MEKSLYSNLLTLQKSLCMLYINGAIESSNEKVRKEFLKGLDESLVLQDEIYQTMTEEGFYNVENLEPTDIEKVCCTLKGNE